MKQGVTGPSGWAPGQSSSSHPQGRWVVPAKSVLMALAPCATSPQDSWLHPHGCQVESGGQRSGVNCGVATLSPPTPGHGDSADLPSGSSLATRHQPLARDGRPPVGSLFSTACSSRSSLLPSPGSRGTPRGTWDWWTLSSPAPLPGLWALAGPGPHCSLPLAAAGFGMGQEPQAAGAEVSGAEPRCREVVLGGGLRQHTPAWVLSTCLPSCPLPLPTACH